MQFYLSSGKSMPSRRPDTFGWWLTDLEDIPKQHSNDSDLSICTDSYSDNNEHPLRRCHSDVLPANTASTNPSMAVSYTTLSQLRSQKIRLGHRESSSSISQDRSNYNRNTSIFNHASVDVPSHLQFEAMMMNRRNVSSMSHFHDIQKASYPIDIQVNKKDFSLSCVHKSHTASTDNSLQENKPVFIPTHLQHCQKASVHLQDNKEPSISSYLHIQQCHIPYSLEDQETFHKNDSQDHKKIPTASYFQSSDKISRQNNIQDSQEDFLFICHPKRQESSVSSCYQESYVDSNSSFLQDSQGNSISPSLQDCHGTFNTSCLQGKQITLEKCHISNQEPSQHISHYQSKEDIISKNLFDEKESLGLNFHQDIKKTYGSSLLQEFLEVSCSTSDIQNNQTTSIPVCLQHNNKTLTAFTITPSELQLTTLLQQRQWCQQSHADHLASLALSIEQDTSPARRQLEAPKATFLATASRLDNELRILTMDAVALHEVAAGIKHDFKSAETAVIQLIDNAHQLVSDLRDLQFLDNLILLLQGQLECIALQRWPFRIGRLPGKGQVNLII